MTLHQDIPSDLDAEQYLLGSIISDTKGDYVGDVLNTVSAVDFFDEKNAYIFRAVMAVHDNNIVPDMVSVRNELDKKNLFDKIGGGEYFFHLAGLPSFACNATYYAEQVKKKSIMRHAIKTLDIMRDGAFSAHDTEEYIKDLEEGMFKLLEKADTSAPQKVSDIVVEVVEDLCSETSEKSIGTGYFELDDMLGGLHNGEMIVIAGRPGMGKTVLGLNILEYAACDLDLPVAMFSIEMGQTELVTRMLTSKSGIDSYNIKKGHNEHHNAKITNAGGSYLDSNMWIDDSGRLTTVELRTKARRLHKQHGIKLIVIDYLQLMTSPNCENRQVEVTSISREVKALAKELDIPIIILSQLNRGNEARTDKRPMMSDLRESGAIEQDADVIILLHRADYYNKHQPGFEATNLGELIVAKQRNGPTGMIELKFSGAYMRFYNREKMNYQALG